MSEVLHQLSPVSTPSATFTTAHNTSSVTLSTSFGLAVGLSDNLVSTYFLLTPCCKQRIFRTDVFTGTCSRCGACPRIPADDNYMASRATIEEALRSWINFYLDPMNAVLVQEVLLGRILAVQESIDNVSALGHSREALEREWVKICRRHSGLIFDA